MKVVALILTNLKANPNRLIGMALLSSIANAIALGIINSGSAAVSGGRSSDLIIVPYLAVILVYAITQNYVAKVSIREIENTVDAIRTRLFDMTARSELQDFERIGGPPIYSAIATETQMISNTVSVLVNGAQSALILFFSFIYLSAISFPAFIIGVILMALSIFVLFRKSREQLHFFSKIFGQQAELLGVLGSLISGFKETKMNSARAEGLMADFQHQSTQTANAMIQGRSLLADSINLSQVLIFFMLGALVFAVPSLFPSESKSVAAAATTVLFMIGPFNTLVNSLPTLSLANAAAEQIALVEARLVEGQKAATQARPQLNPWSAIRLDNVRFSYPQTGISQSFHVGPIDIGLLPGETVFITGGNGSGKTTLLRLLVGLYTPADGHVAIDRVIVDESNLQAYRDLFAVVFADCHLFSRLYGIDEAKFAIIDPWIERLDLRGKTQVVDGRFSTVDLSTGQRKRIAFLVAMLEDRPIVVFDEWAADQDPEYRHNFYHQLLPDLKAQGKTVIAITHDDRYFSCADRLIKMENGKIVADSRRSPNG